MRSRSIPLLATVLATIVLGDVCLARRPAEPTPSTDAQPQRVTQLIHQLGDADFFVRERAQSELAKLGVEAFDALSAAESSSDVEIADRAQYLLRKLKVDWIQPDDSADVRLLLEQYLAAEPEQRASLLKRLASLADNRDVPALCRIVRYERSTALSKRAALELIEQKPQTGAAHDERREMIETGLGTSPRAGAQWLRASLLAETNPAASAEAWQKYADAELHARGDLRDRSDDDIVFRVLRQQALLLRQLGRADDNVAVMRRMIEVGPDDDETFGELMGWLVDQKAWSVVDEAASRFRERFDHDPLLLYTLAQAAEGQGRSDEARQIADRARALNEGNGRYHLYIAYRLQLRGRFDWSEQEYRLAIQLSDPGTRVAFEAHKYLAEMLHDMQREQSAGETLQQGVAGVEGQLNAGRDNEVGSEELDAIRARMHFFLACAEAGQNREKQIEHLLEGITFARDDADILIALYRIPDPEPELRKKTLDWIRRAADEFREKMQQMPDEPNYYNQFAWLIANTEGDRDEALRASQKSLELKPGSAGYLDTLARCLYAKGDFAAAVENQSHALELEPYSGAMRRQLELFRQALADR